MHVKRAITTELATSRWHACVHDTYVYMYNMSKDGLLHVCVRLSSPQDVEEKVRVARSLPCAAHGFLCFEELQERALQLAWRLRLAGGRRLLRALAMSLVEPLDKVSSAQAGEDQTWVGTSDHPVEEIKVTRLTSIIATSICVLVAIL